MHIETLKTFCDLVETGSFSRAARLNYVSQSAVSQQVKALEARYNTVLIERGPRHGATLTDTGRLLYGECKPLLERLRYVEERLRHPATTMAGPVRIATVYSVGLHALRQAVCVRFVVAEQPRRASRVNLSRLGGHRHLVDADISGQILEVPVVRLIDARQIGFTRCGRRGRRIHVRFAIRTERHTVHRQVAPLRRQRGGEQERGGGDHGRQAATTGSIFVSRHLAILRCHPGGVKEAGSISRRGEEPQELWSRAGSFAM